MKKLKAKLNSCSHIFCSECILEWSQTRAVCPNCKNGFYKINGDFIESQAFGYLAIRSIIFKLTKGNAPDTEQMNNRVREMIKEALEKKYNDAPDLGINFMVDKVFIQTPGPEAGKVIER